MHVTARPLIFGEVSLRFEPPDRTLRLQDLRKMKIAPEKGLFNTWRRERDSPQHYINY